MYITKENLSDDVQNLRNPFHFAANWKKGHKMYIPKNNLLVDVPNSRNPFHFAGSCKKDPKGT